MPHNTNMPDPNRRQTRPQNAHAHPGKVVLEALCAHHNKEEIEAEKRGQEERRENREKKKATKKAAVLEIARFENNMMIEDAKDEDRFPRNRSKVNLIETATTKGKKRKAQTTNFLQAISQGKNARQSLDGGDTDCDAESEQNRVKKQRKAPGNGQALHRTETYIEMSNADTGVRERKATGYGQALRRTETYIDMPDADTGARQQKVTAEGQALRQTETYINVSDADTGARKQKAIGKGQALRRTETYIDASDADTDARKQKAIGKGQVLHHTGTDIDMPDADTGITSDSDSSEDETLTPKPKKVVRDTSESDEWDWNQEVEIDDNNFETPRLFKTRRSNIIFSDDVEMSDASTNARGVDDLDKSETLDSESDLHDKVASQKLNIPQAGHKDNTRKKKKNQAFRNEVQETRVVLANQGLIKQERTVPAHLIVHSPGDNTKLVLKPARNGPNGPSGVKKTATSKSTGNIGRPTQASYENGPRLKKPKSIVATTESIRGASHASSEDSIEIVEIQLKGVKDSSSTLRKKASDAQAKSNPRASATIGNNVDVGQAVAVVHKSKSSKSKPMVATTETRHAAGDFSDEDDSIERAVIMQSPPKGLQRLSSATVVKIEKPTSKCSTSETKKSRSKESILGSRDVVFGWSKFIEPAFVYWFYYDMAPWPSTQDIETCAQRLWDWRFGDTHPLVLANSPQHVQLLTQKLCDIRSHSAIAAIANLDHDFWINIDEDLIRCSQNEITLLRKEYAEDLLHDMKFVFGKYVVDRDGRVRKSRPYQSNLLLHTFSTFFKYIKDVQHDPDTPLPPSGYPKTALAIAVVVVERALKLCINDHYDFIANKLIPKPDPNHPNRKPTTNMFAFSETAWEEKIELHLAEGIAKLKEKDWKNILDAAAQYSNFVNPNKPCVTSRNPSQEALALTWDSDSDD